MKRRSILAGLLATGLARPARAELRPFARGTWQSLLNANKNHRAIVHFWGITCGPCMTELPVWGKLLRDRPNAPLIMIAADLAPQPDDALVAVLARAGLAGVQSWRFGTAFSDRLYFEVDPEWQGELPRTVLLSADGTQDSWLGDTDFARLGAWLVAP